MEVPFCDAHFKTARPLLGVADEVSFGNAPLTSPGTYGKPS
jgi:hypothetical protein